MSIFESEKIFRTIWGGRFNLKKNFVRFIVVIFMLTICLVACNKENNKETDSKNATGNVVEVNIKAKNFEFDQKEIHAKVGDMIKLSLTNETGLHGIQIDGVGQIQDGETIEFVAKEPGEIEFWCSIVCGQGHNNMEGKIIVD